MNKIIGDTMKNKKNPLLLATSICLILLAVISLVYALITNLGLVNILPKNIGQMPAMGEGEDRFLPEKFPGQSEGQQSEGRPEQPFGDRQGDGTPPEDIGDRQRIQGDNFQQGDSPQNFNKAGVFGGYINRWLVIGAYAVALILAVLAVIFIRRGKKWGVILGISLSILLAGVALFSLINAINWWLTIIISLVKLLLGIAVIVLLLLPGAHKVYAKKNDIFTEEDYAIYYGEGEVKENVGDETESESI
jgi:hypothetical protein